MEIKKHYKLYKDGKNWCAMALAVTAVSAGLVLGNTNVKADTPTDNVPVVKTTNPTTGDANAELASQEKAAQAKDNGNYGYLDAAQVVNNNDLQVSGWQATNQAAGKDNRYLVAYDSTTNTELGRTPVTENVARPDVAKAYPEVVNVKDSGYQATMNNLDWSKVKSVDDQIHIVSRYSDAANGEGNHVDNWSQPINLDKGNYAYLDSFGVKDNQLQVSGWNATNKALGKKYHYVILYDRTAGHEITRTKIEPIARPDVARGYSQVINAKNSGFNTAFSLAGIDLNHELQIISRYSDDANGEGNYVSYWYAPKKLAPANTRNQGSLDSFNISNGQLTVTGWHATDYSQVENNHYLILFDNTNKTQVKSIKITNVARPDVAKAYPTVATAGQSGFNANFGTVNLTPGHNYSIVSRYSTLDGGNGDNGQSKTTDYWFAPVTLNQQASYVDSFTKTDNGYNVKGWMVSDQSINKPNAYLILLNDGQEIARTKVELTDRPDVAKVYPSIYNSQKSGFNGEFKVDSAKPNGTLKVIMRFAGDDANKNFSDQYSQDYPTNAGNFDNIHVTASQVSLSGWHASTQAGNKPYEWLIVLDNNGQELYRQEITGKGLGRNDIQNVYPYIEGANKSGFQIVIPTQENMLHKVVKIINRLTDDSAGNGNYIDIVSRPISILSGAQTEGRKTTIYNDNGQIVAVYNDAEVISQLPELPTGCEITAVTMMLRYAGYDVNKVQLANIMPRSNNGDYGFVGNPFSLSGWWIFPTGIAPVVDRFVGHHEIMTGTSMQRIQDKLKQGHLVVAWVANVNGFVNHALALTGYDASRLFYNNPWTGRKESMTYGEFYQHWNADRQRAISY
ncbi:N-acetylmuramoyl-L-alanine amidase [Limosilactobacillus reuteri]|uniref:C39 family peptidase n=1 Tax=Limosilactobacillus reuteri TaxID=1598 RepID=UPI000B98F40C|nr:C39 family peptidase [Limosilactobacillus reuteri]OYS49488.1 N-acetylmuramoyl-L-alanine amidase [Limosilactobacillus reuteri]OYS51389.1 N-acetylmuramoyl-L-alanine amidase [Limosilactobacillus reuteri]OYS53577.1 N-acetylmuramoyl-L-alanine amidase [Limosilactobacillus reuteri]OYS56816.1 N-acetylmuramoyl-L-alanine amidase [Limosilactobacillus reuteri]OYS67969.1 N-acetylmuramoyl-L-alanine amidase [Limosilactobacillus reuteri]